VLFPRSFKISLLLSLLIHFGVFIGLNHETIARRVLAAPVPLMARKSEPKVVRFELVDTPASAETAQPPEKKNLFSDKNTRAQDRVQGDKKLSDSPHVEGKREDSKDTRPRNVVTAPSVPPPQPAKPKEEAPDRRPEQPSPREKEERISPRDFAGPREAREPEEKRVEIQPERKEKEVIQLAKKSPSAVEQAPANPQPATPRVISAASPRNTDTDAQITGEPSFAATRHFFGEYLLQMKEAVERQWVSRLVSRYTGIVSSEAVIDYKIQPDGTVTDMVVESSEGDSYFPLVCVSSINDAQPFGKIPYDEIQGLPDEFVNKPLNIRFTFRYN